MTMASHQTFSGQLWHLTDQTDQTNLPYIINGEVNKFHRHRKLFKTGGGLYIIEVIRTHLYGEKLHSYGMTVKTGEALAPP